MPVKRLQRGLQPGWQFERVELLIGAAPFFGHVLADVFPEVAEDRHFFTGDVFRDRHARQFDDATFDGIHQREVTHRPGE